ncbi:o-succinylbenzoate--CoA ligase [Bacillus kexueae]|uniref:o-succinylbenzoate--CoA ligase n=1 Tax=Aeribacillus kexueae TaxID=2078952 RepID=UPI001FAEBD35|nr:o-succinylbenzoate--CoA ligase [Bacillus kexueae]
MTSIPNWLKKRAHLTPDRIALTVNEENITFSMLERLVSKRARQLATLGVQRHDYVGILMKNSIEMVITIHAIHYIGAVAVFFNNRLTEREITWQTNDASVKFTIYDEHTAHLSHNLIAVSIKEIQTLEESDVEIMSEYHLNEVATVMYTSGTTGNPKGVLQTYGNHWWSAIGSVLNIGLQEKDTWLCAVPLFHISGLSILMRSIIYGIRVILHPSFHPEKANEAIINEGVSIVSVVSTMLQQMIDGLGGKNYPSTFRCMLLGGGPAPLSLLQKCQKKEIDVFQTYGMTETASQVVTLAPEYSVSKLGSAGKPLYPVEMRILKDGKACNPFEEGEIVIKGPNVTIGYLNRPDATGEAIRDGWFYTGDIGYVDEEGFLYVLDRRKDLIVSGGENVYPAEVEAILVSHEYVEDAGVIGRKDAKWGQVPVAFVVTSKQISELELIAFCQKQLAKYKIPKEIRFVKNLPRNASKKLLRRKLQEWLDDE